MGDEEWNAKKCNTFGIPKSFYVKMSLQGICILMIGFLTIFKS